MNSGIDFWTVELALTGLSILGIIWNKKIVPRREGQRIREILDHEREPDVLTREILIRKLYLGFLSDLLWFFPALAGLHLFLRYLNSAKPDLPAWGPKDLPFWGPIVLLSAMGLYMLFETLRKVAAVRKGKYRVQKLSFSGVKTTRNAKGVESSREYLGKHKGDLYVPSPVPLRPGLWYYVLVIRQEAALVLPVELWQLEPGAGIRR